MNARSGPKAAPLNAATTRVHDQRSPQRDSYRSVGEATRAAIELAIAEEAPTRALRILLAVIHVTTTYSRVGDHITRRRLMELTGMSEREVTRGITWLRKAGVVSWTPGYSIAGVGRAASFVSLTGGHVGPGSAETPGAVEGRDRGSMRALTGGPRCPTTEELPEEVPGAGGAEAPAAALDEPAVAPLANDIRKKYSLGKYRTVSYDVPQTVYTP